MVESLLALDLASTTGYAHWSVGAPKPSAGVLSVEKKGNLEDNGEIGQRLAQVYKWTLRKIKEWAVTDICCEAPLTGGVPGDQYQHWWLISEYGVITMLGAQMGVNVVPIANKTMVLHWLGSGDIEKRLRKTYSVLEAQRRGFPNIKDHNTADSLGLLSLRCAMLNLSPPWDYKRSPGPLFTGAGRPQGVEITKSNKLAAARLMNSAMSFDAEKKP